MTSLLCFLFLSPFVTSSSDYTSGFTGSSSISPKDRTPAKQWPFPRIPGSTENIYVNIAGFGSGQDWTVMCGDPDQQTQCFLFKREGTSDWKTREVLHQDAPPNGRQEWGRHADADGNFAAVTAVRPHNGLTQEVQVHLWQYNYVGTHNVSYVNIGTVEEEYWNWVHPEPFTFYYDGFTRPFKVAVDASGIVVVWGLTQNTAGVLTEGQVHVWGYNETLNAWDKLSRSDDDDFIPVICHHCEELELVVKPGGNEIYIVGTIENGPRMEKESIYRLRKEDHYQLNKNDETSILIDSVMEVNGGDWKVRELMYVNDKLVVALRHSSKIFIIDVENNNHMVVNDVGTVPKLMSGDGDLFFTVHVEPDTDKVCVDRQDELRAAKVSPSITCESEYSRLQNCDFRWEWGKLQDYCCETCAPFVNYVPMNLTTIRVWGIGLYMDALELVEVGSIDPFEYCFYKPDVTVDHIVASGNYLHAAVKDCHNIYTMTISDVEINRITTTGTPDFPCEIEAFVLSLGDSMEVYKANSTEDCGVLCKYNERCSHWTYEIEIEECVLHQHFYGQEPNPKFVSGTRCEGIIPPVCMLTQESQEYKECEEQWNQWDLQALQTHYACPMLSTFVRCLTSYDCSKLLPHHLKVFRQESCNFAFCEKDAERYQECVSDFNAEETKDGVATCESTDNFQNCISICDLTNYQQSLVNGCENGPIITNAENEKQPIRESVVMILAIILSGTVIGGTLCYMIIHRRQRSSEKRKPEDRRRDPAFKARSVQIGSSPREGGGTRDRSESRDILGRPKKRFAKEEIGTKRRPENDVGSGEPAWKRKPSKTGQKLAARNDPARKKKDPTSNDAYTPPVMSSHLRTPPDNYNNSFFVGSPSMGGNMLVSQSRPRSGSDETYQSEV